MRMSSAGDLGVSDIPMKLMIAAVITSLALPVFWGAYSDLSEKMTLSSLEMELGGLLASVDDVMSGDTGSTLEVGLTIASWGSCNIEKVAIGGGPKDVGPTPYKVEYSVSGSGSSFLTLDPPVMMTSGQGGQLVLQDGHFEIRITHVVIDGKRAAELEVL